MPGPHQGSSSFLKNKNKRHTSTENVINATQPPFPRLLSFRGVRQPTPAAPSAFRRRHPWRQTRQGLRRAFESPTSRPQGSRGTRCAATSERRERAPNTASLLGSKGTRGTQQQRRLITLVQEADRWIHTRSHRSRPDVLISSPKQKGFLRDQKKKKNKQGRKQPGSESDHGRLPTRPWS